MITENANGSRRWRRTVLILVPLMTLVFVPWQMAHGQAPTPAPKPTVAVSDYLTMPVGDKKVTGVVRNEKNEPAAGMAVSLTWHWKQIQKAGEMQSGSIVVGHTLTDAQGRFSFANLPAGEFRYGIWSQANLYVPLEDHLTISPTDSHLILNPVTFLSESVELPITRFSVNVSTAQHKKCILNSGKRPLLQTFPCFCIRSSSVSGLTISP